MDSEVDTKSDISNSDETINQLGTSLEGDEQSEDGDINLSPAKMEKFQLYQNLLNKAGDKLNMFQSRLMSQFSEAFKLLDVNRDGIIDEKDLRITFNSLGLENISEEYIKKMIQESTTPIDFNTFVGLFENKEEELDSATDLIKAFYKWDHNSDGYILEEGFKRDVQTRGNRLSENEIEKALEEAPIYDNDDTSIIDYIEFCANLCGLQNIRSSELFKEKCMKK